MAVHAIRNLARIGFGTVAVRWSQLGFGRTSSTTQAQVTPRNLFGFKDGTANIKAEEPEALDEHVWVTPTAGRRDAWLAGGTYLVARRINMTIEIWDRQSLRDQENIIGRTKARGRPAVGRRRSSPSPTSRFRDATARSSTRPRTCALAHPEHNDGVRMLRRGYNFVDGSTPLGRLDAGLFFVAFVSDPRTHFIPMQTRLAKQDLMSEYLQHTGSGLFAVPPGVRAGGYVGEALFG